MRYRDQGVGPEFENPPVVTVRPSTQIGTPDTHIAADAQRALVGISGRHAGITSAQNTRFGVGEPVALAAGRPNIAAALARNPGDADRRAPGA